MILEVDPNVVKPGWTPLLITIALAVVIALLMWSMRRQMRKITVPHADEVRRGRAAGSDGGSTESATDPEAGDDARSIDSPGASAGSTGPR